ncbi:hypothetical protein LEMLEM_LOCUS22824 [Lemmus lemmus]
MVRDEERFTGCGSRLTTWGVLSLTSKTVGQGSLDVLLLGSLQVLLLPAPGLQSRGLQGSAIRESQGPWLQQWTLVDGIEVDGRLFLALPSRQESDSSDSRGHCAAQCCDSCHGNLLIRIFLGTSMAWGDHVGLQQCAFQIDMVVTQSLVHSSQNLLSYILAAL